MLCWGGANARVWVISPVACIYVYSSIKDWSIVSVSSDYDRAVSAAQQASDLHSFLVSSLPYLSLISCIPQPVYTLSERMINISLRRVISSGSINYVDSAVIEGNKHHQT